MEKKRIYNDTILVIVIVLVATGILIVLLAVIGMLINKEKF